jgi:hypothetical protein
LFVLFVLNYRDTLTFGMATGIISKEEINEGMGKKKEYNSWVYKP